MGILIILAAIVLLVLGISAVFRSSDSGYSDGGGYHSPPVVGGGKFSVFNDSGSSGMGHQESVKIDGETYRVESHDSYLGRTVVSNTQPYQGGERKVIDSHGNVSDHSPY